MSQSPNRKMRSETFREAVKGFSYQQYQEEKIARQKQEVARRQQAEVLMERVKLYQGTRTEMTEDYQREIQGNYTPALHAKLKSTVRRLSAVNPVSVSSWWLWLTTGAKIRSVMFEGRVQLTLWAKHKMVFDKEYFPK